MPSDQMPHSGRRRTDATAPAYAQRYGDALGVPDPAAAEQVVDDALAAGLAPAAIQSLVIEPAMIRVGELWEANTITVADEHLATAITQGVLIRLLERLTVARPRSRDRILLAATEGQVHVLGLRMVADVLEGAGYEVLYLGGDVPVEALTRFAAEQQPAVTGLAVGMSVGVGALAESIHAVHEACPATRIMLGGRAVPQSLVDAGYPRVASSLEAVATVERLLQEPSRPAPQILDLLRPQRREPAQGRVASESQSVAELLAEVAEDHTEKAREQVRRAWKYKDLAFRDPVTDLNNRRAFDDRMYAQAQAEESDTHGALLMIDVDKFKTINDTHGHAVGDRVLRQIGLAITQTIRSHDFAARVGGDEFTVLLPKAGMDEARDVGARIRLAVAEDTDPPVTVSVGLALLSEDTRGAVLAADLALYEAKGAGRDRVVDAASPLQTGSQKTRAGS